MTGTCLYRCDTQICEDLCHSETQICGWPRLVLTLSPHCGIKMINFALTMPNGGSWSQIHFRNFTMSSLSFWTHYSFNHQKWPQSVQQSHLCFYDQLQQEDQKQSLCQIFKLGRPNPNSFSGLHVMSVMLYSTFCSSVGLINNAV